MEAVVELLPPLPLRHHVVDLAAVVAAGRRRLGVLILLPAAGGGAGQRRGPLRPHGEAAAPDRHVAGVVAPACWARLHCGGLRGRGVVLAQRRRRGLGGGGRRRGDDGHHGAHERLVLAGGESGRRRGVRGRGRREEAARGGQGGVVEREEGGPGAAAVDGEGALGGERRGRVHRLLLLGHQVVAAVVLGEEAGRVHAVRRRRLLSAGRAAGEVGAGDAEARGVGGEEAGGAAEQEIATKAEVSMYVTEERAIELLAATRNARRTLGHLHR